mmetsp:Transcript_85815/g.243389  ORF Transcript_85815/g.243389 Transcript_85815/m.243389 type:complete len:156 (+) Transcript_85815:86-553(+)
MVFRCCCSSGDSDPKVDLFEEGHTATDQEAKQDEVKEARDEDLLPSPAPGQPPETDQVAEFRLKVDKSQGDGKIGLATIGIEKGPRGWEALSIQKVIPNGCVARWNNDYPDKEVRKGDIILEVNGINKNCNELYETIAKDAKLDILIIRQSRKVE